MVRWKLEKNECPHCRKPNPVQIPLQLRGIGAVCSELRKLKNVDNLDSTTANSNTTNNINSVSDDELPDLDF